MSINFELYFSLVDMTCPIITLTLLFDYNAYMQSSPHVVALFAHCCMWCCIQEGSILKIYLKC